ncbi:MAG: chromate resistance protein ChrB domain-containing protein [Vicinamibacterales bacterium]
MSSEAKWLLLAFQLPAHPSNARVKTWRRLRQIGAVPTRNAVYVLPHADQCREDFEWLRGEIAALGGAATVFAADTLDAGGEEDIVSAFKRARDEDYRALAQDAQAALKAGGSRESRARGARTLRDRLAQIERIDFHQAPARGLAERAVEALERVLAPAAPKSAAKAPAQASARRPRGARWVTRPRPGVDRMASAWLIRTRIDPKARFAFVESPQAGDLPFDMYTGTFSHRGGLCTFEVLCEAFGLADAATEAIGRLVHDLDLKESKYALPETAAVGRMVEGLRAAHADDRALLEHGMVMFEALARSFASEATPAVRGRTAPRTRRRS